ncbi:MAG: hypothetical protein KC472_12630 [Dehalococcoidia bacterium]|nr:hypothetical protein [Dehalococcoidia bacterium]
MILVQREFTVPPEHKAEFERQSREGLWPTFLHFGAQMVAFGSWAFGDDSVPLVTHSVRGLRALGGDARRVQPQRDQPDAIVL